MTRLLEARDLHTWFYAAGQVIKAVDGVSVSLDRGKTLGIVGESGSGKSALVRSIMGLYDSARLARYDGQVRVHDTDIRALPPGELYTWWGAEVGIVFQDPMRALNPVMRVGKQVVEILIRQGGLGRVQARERALQLLKDVGIPDPERRFMAYPHQLSGGMRQRVTIAIALACQPSLLIADEPTTALDVTIQAQILALLRRLQEATGMSLIIVSHDLGVVGRLSDDIAVMYAGRLVEYASAEAVIDDPKMPYTEALLESTPSIDMPAKLTLPVIPGRPPSLREPVPGCAFHTRCRYAQERCARDEPELVHDNGRAYACWYPVGSGAPDSVRSDKGV